MLERANPFELCVEWFREVEALALENPTAVALSTVGANGTPSSRMVLIRRFDGEGFQFFTNYESRKARELAANPRAALLFYWEPLHRQLRVIGTAEKVSSEESDAYFRTRPRGSQIGAHASPQSEVIPYQETLERRVAEVEARFDGVEVPRPQELGWVPAAAGALRVLGAGSVPDARASGVSARE